MENNTLHKLGIDIGSTTVKVAILDQEDHLLFSDYERHFANIQETLSSLLQKAYDALGDFAVAPMITGSGGLTLAKHLGVPFVQEVIAVSTALQHYAPQTDVAIELGGEDAKIIYFEGGNVEQRMIFLSIAHNETPTVRVDNILPLETGRGVEADGFEFVQCFGDSETFG